ncbi:MAG: adenylate/guanylate cyclase domain-containing protein [Granulosicoccus sp.]
MDASDHASSESSEQSTGPIAIGAGPWRKNLRLYSGLILFVFAGFHLVNHALGLVSIEAMEAMQNIRYKIWRSLPGSIVLYGALLLHVVLALSKFVKRRSWRMTFWEAVQLVFGLTIPFILMGHIFATRLSYEIFGVDDRYSYILSVMWPNSSYSQGVLMVLVWVHGCIGLHFWLRLKPWYPKTVWLMNSVAVIVPVLAFAGFAVAGRQIVALGDTSKTLTAEHFATIIHYDDIAQWLLIGLIGAAVAYRLMRDIGGRFGPTAKVTYADGRVVTSEIGPTLLEISRSNGVPHASVCGGRARCSTCRVRILDGLESLPAASEEEARVLKRVGAGENVRLACQLKPVADVSVATLLPAQLTKVSDAASQDKYLWGVDQSVTLLFADIRGFTAMSESKLPYDVVFVLNQYLGQMSDAISDAGGYVDKFIGDGIMAIFGMDRSSEQGARDALAAAQAMSGVLLALNKSLAADLDKPLSIGIGIHSGPAILGRIGVSGASGAAQRITALGDTVNTASRLESACKDLRCQLVVSRSTVTAAQMSVTGGQDELITVKGREEKVAILTFPSAMNMNTLIS